MHTEATGDEMYNCVACSVQAQAARHLVNRCKERQLLPTTASYQQDHARLQYTTLNARTHVTGRMPCKDHYCLHICIYYIRIYTTPHCRFFGHDGGKETMEQGASSTTCLGTPDLRMHRQLHDTPDVLALQPDNSAEHDLQPQHHFAAPTNITSQLSQWTLTAQGVFNPSSRSPGQGFPPAHRTTARCHAHGYIPPPP